MTCKDNCLCYKPCAYRMIDNKWERQNDVEKYCDCFKDKANYLNAPAFIKAIDKYAEVLKGNVFSVEKMADDIKELVKRCLNNDL